jgi:hypothetical protein
MALKRGLGLLVVSFGVLAGGLSARAATADWSATRTDTNQPARGLVQRLIYPGLTLKPTAAAPLDTHATVQLERRHRKLKAQVTGLAPGVYLVRATRKSDQTLWLLGTLLVSNPSQSPDKSAHQDMRQDYISRRSSTLQTQTLLPLPRPLKAKDISRISILDPGGVVLLQGGP